LFATTMTRRRSSRSTTVPAYGPMRANTSVSAARTAAPQSPVPVSCGSRTSSGMIANQSPPRAISCCEVGPTEVLLAAQQVEVGPQGLRETQAPPRQPPRCSRR
jgi:hypothetical protein